MQVSDDAPQWCPPVGDIDTLELLRIGALGERGELWPQGSIRIDVPPELSENVAGQGSGVVELVDPEGVPLALIRVAAANGSAPRVVAVEKWLSFRSGRPFERFHRPPSDFAEAAPTLVVDQWTDPHAVATMARASAAVRVVVLASVAADGSGQVTSAIRALEHALAPFPGTDLVVVPADRTFAEVIGTAYAKGGEVTSMWGSPAAEHSADRGVALLLTGLSGSGKSTIARAVRDHMLESSEQSVTLLDGDVVRRRLSAGLTFSAADRETNIRRIGWVAAEIAHHGGLAICSPIAPFASTRSDVRRYVEDRGGRFVLVHVATPLEECERRDRKGLYRRARAGLIAEFTGISSPYEEPTDADLVLDTTNVSIEHARNQVLALILPMLPEAR